MYTCIQKIHFLLAKAFKSTPTQLADETLFKAIRYNKHHVLQQFLPDHNSHNYSLRPRRHNFILPTELTIVTL